MQYEKWEEERIVACIEANAHGSKAQKRAFEGETFGAEGACAGKTANKNAVYEKNGEKGI